MLISAKEILPKEIIETYHQINILVDDAFVKESEKTKNNEDELNHHIDEIKSRVDARAIAKIINKFGLGLSSEELLLHEINNCIWAHAETLKLICPRYFNNIRLFGSQKALSIYEDEFEEEFKRKMLLTDSPILISS